MPRKVVQGNTENLNLLKNVAWYMDIHILCRGNLLLIFSIIILKHLLLYLIII